MRAEDLETGTVPELAYGTVFTGPNGQRLILGDTDTVAYEDADGSWHVAENVVWDRVEFFAGAMEGARQRDHHRTLKGYALSWAQEHGTNVYEGISDDIRKHVRFMMESNPPELTEDDLDTILNLLEGASITFNE